MWLLGFGWEGGYFLEDMVCVGAIVSLFWEKGIDFIVGNDEVVVV